MRGTMPHYLIYTLAGKSRIVAPPDEVECKNDEEAINEAYIMMDGDDVEVWAGPRHVMRIKAFKPN